MDRAILELKIDLITLKDVPGLTKVMTRAFDDDIKKHLGLESGGPRGYDDGSFFKKWLFDSREAIGFKVKNQGEIIAGVIVQLHEDRHNVIEMLFVDPEYQDMGIGRRIIRFIEDTYDQTLSWRLATPHWSSKNHFFFEEKCGYRKVQKDLYMGSPRGNFVYRKDMV